jgi:hypothetical protein
MITPEQFNNVRVLGGCLPETIVGPGKSVMVSLVNVAYLDSLSVPWFCMHVTDLVGVPRNSVLVTASKSADASPGAPTAVTANSPFFLSTDVGSTITWANGYQSYITSYTSSTLVTVTNVSGLTNPATASQSGYFVLNPTVPDIINTALGCAVCGIQSTSPDHFNLPGGCPESAITSSAIGVVAAPFQPRFYSGPDKIAVSVLNNTRNFELHVAVNTAMRYTRGI